MKAEGARVERLRVGRESVEAERWDGGGEKGRDLLWTVRRAAGGHALHVRGQGSRQVMWCSPPRARRAAYNGTEQGEGSGRASGWRIGREYGVCREDERILWRMVENGPSFVCAVLAGAGGLKPPSSRSDVYNNLVMLLVDGARTRDIACVVGRLRHVCGRCDFPLRAETRICVNEYIYPMHIPEGV